ncbi:MAG: helix-turn-helix transcriptional regulator [Pseudomonadota bacterium]
MDLKLNEETLKRERQRRAWSQEHLAEVSGLSLRTVQRLEQTGRASFESARSLAAVFDLDVEQLRAPATRPRGSIRRPAFAALGVAVVACLGFVLTSASIAEPILLNFDVARTNEASGEEVRHVGRIETEEGSAAEVEVEGHLRLIVKPVADKDGRVRLFTELYELVDGAYVLLAKPQLTTEFDEEAAILFGVEGGKVYWLQILPQRG